MDPIAITTSSGWASISYQSDWGGGGGQWYLHRSGMDSLVLEDPAAVNAYNQLEYLQALSSEKYIFAVVDSDWQGLGNSDDAIYRALQHVNFSDEDAQKYLEVINSLTQLEASILERIKGTSEVINEILADISPTSRFSDIPVPGTDMARGFYQSGNLFASSVANLRDTYAGIINVYQAVKHGNPIGLQWSNQRFLHDFPDTHEADIVSAHLEGKTYE